MKVLALGIFAACILAFTPWPDSVMTPDLGARGYGSILVDDADKLLGVWGAERRFGPDLQGPIRLTQQDGSLIAQIGPHVTEAQRDGNAVFFDLENERGSFKGTMSDDVIAGHWIQQSHATEGYRFATPLRLESQSGESWEGMVRPFRYRLGFYLNIRKGDSGKTEAILRNPERNQGRFFRIDHVRLDGSDVRFYRADSSLAFSGTYNENDGVLSVYFQGGGLTFDFTRRDRHEAPGIYPRPEQGEYTYQKPIDRPDGWTTASAGSVGMDEQRLASFVNSILENESTSSRTPAIQGLVIARQGKLVLEEYFHGYHQDEPHDSRSAGKSITSMMVGKAVDEGAFAVDTKVYPLFPESTANPDPRKADLEVSHLLTMSAGYDCDDNNFDSPGNEDRMQSQSEQPDWRRYTLDLPMVTAPGESGVYCTGGINLLGAVIAKTTGEWIPEFFRTRLAEPLDIDLYHMNLDPMDRGYGGGGLRLKPRDFAKFGQVMIDGGTWNGSRILSENWVSQSLKPYASVNIDDDYGYGWWRTIHEKDGVTFESWSATGNGGQLIIVVPEYDLVVAFNGGSYGDFRTWIRWRDELMPEYIIDAIR